MAVTIKIPTPLRKFTAEKDLVVVDGNTVGEALKDLDAKHPGLWQKLCDDEGKVRRFINVYAGEDDIRFLDGLQTKLDDGAELAIVPAIAGGG
jgi:molybdopterin synthase sulfur carrier subunit